MLEDVDSVKDVNVQAPITAKPAGRLLPALFAHERNAIGAFRGVIIATPMAIVLWLSIAVLAHWI